jgi:hypothetical protein
VFVLVWLAIVSGVLVLVAFCPTLVTVVRMDVGVNVPVLVA